MITPEQKLKMESYLKSSGYVAPEQLDNTQSTGSSWYDAVQSKVSGTVQKEKGFVENVKESFKERTDKGAEAFMRDQGAGSTALQLAGQTAGFVGDVTSEAIMSIPVIGQALKTFTEDAGQSIGEGKGVIADFINSDIGKKAISSYQSLDPEVKANIDALFNIATLVPVGKGASVAGKGIVKGATQATESVLETGAKTLAKGKDIAKGVMPIIDVATREAKRIPSRIGTNLASKVEERAIINELPTKVAKQAVTDGVDIQVVKDLYTIPKSIKPQAKELFNTAKEFIGSGKKTTDPLEIVGRPITKRIKDLKTEADVVGKELKQVSKNLGVVTQEELIKPVFERLSKAIDGLKLTKIGTLDFKNTSIGQTKETLADRKAIQNIFRDATKYTTGEKKHKLRQELFEVLGGKKLSKQPITDTQDKAYEAVRQGLADVLETKNPKYKELNMKYAKIAEPLKELRKKMGSVFGADEDIADMSAGLIARRLTSMAKSNPEIRNTLRAMDEAISTAKGTTEGSVEALQDFYNILDDYYDLSGGTSMKGVIKSAQGIPNITTMASEAVGGVFGKTKEVQLKALEKVIDDILNN